MRLWLALGLGVMALLCLGGVGVFVSLYDSATQIKRSDPDAVVDNFLRGYLVDRDDDEVALYACQDGAGFPQLAALRTQLVDRERNFGVKVAVTWGSLAVTGTGNERRSVATDLIISGSSDGQTRSRHTESWRFDLVDQNGWRVCGATKVS